MPKNLRKRDGIWQARFTYKGQYIEKSLETQDLAEARKRLANLRDRTSSEKWGTASHTVSEMLDRFESEHFRTLKPGAARRYKFSIAELKKHLGSIELNELDRTHLSAFERSRIVEVKSPTVRRDLAALSSALSQADAWGWVQGHNPVRGYLRSRKNALKESKAKTTHWTPEEESRALDIAPKWLKTLVSFIIDTGLRREEVFSLRWENINLDRSELHVRADVAKSGVGRTIPILPRTLANLKEMHRPSGFVFVSQRTGKRYSPTAPSINDALIRLCARANATRVSVHDLRRTSGVRLIREYRWRIEEISHFLGHASIGVTQRHYSFLSVDSLHAAVARSIKEESNADSNR